MSCATLTLKYFICIFNILLALLGITVIVLNALALTAAEPDIELNITLMLLLGLVIFIVPFFGCFGAILENKCLLLTYAVFVLVVIVSTLTILLAYSTELSTTERAQQWVDETWEQTLNGTGSMTAIQEEYNCCGKNSEEDYIDANITIPASCYIGYTDFIWPHGCLYDVTRTYESIDEALCVFRWTMFSVECFALLCACILAITFGKQQRISRV